MKNEILYLLFGLGVAYPAKLKAQNTDIPQFSHSTIFVTDLKTAVDFYTNIIQLPVIPEPFHDGRHVWFKVGPHSQIHVVSGARSRIAHDINIHMAFSVASVDRFIQHLDAVGQKYGNWNISAKSIQLRPDGIKQIYLQDPDGYWIEINDDVK